MSRTVPVFFQLDPVGRQRRSSQAMAGDLKTHLRVRNGGGMILTAGSPPNLEKRENRPGESQCLTAIQSEPSPSRIVIRNVQFLKAKNPFHPHAALSTVGTVGFPHEDQKRLVDFHPLYPKPSDE